MWPHVYVICACLFFFSVGDLLVKLHKDITNRQEHLSGQVRKILPPPGLDPRTVQPVAIRYTDYATRPTISRVL